MPAEGQGSTRLQQFVFTSGASDPIPAEAVARRFVALTCGPENVRDFNARLRAEVPEAFALAKAFEAAGLIDGLRGAKIAPAGGLADAGVAVALSDAAEARLAGKRGRAGAK